MNKLFFWMLVALLITGCHIGSLGLIVIAIIFLYLWSAYLLYLYIAPKRATIVVDKEALLFLLKVVGNITVADMTKHNIGIGIKEKDRSIALDRVWKDMNKCSRSR